MRIFFTFEFPAKKAYSNILSNITLRHNFYYELRSTFSWEEHYVCTNKNLLSLFPKKEKATDSPNIDFINVMTNDRKWHP